MVDPFTAPNRRHQDRKTVRFKTFLRVDGVATACDVLDISPGGTRVKTALRVAVQTAVVLVIKQLGDFKAHISWSRNGEIGLQFEESPERIAQALEIITLYDQASPG